MRRLPIPEKLKDIFTDTLWSAAGLVLMNVVAQFAVYPCWNRALGSEHYGNIVFLMAVANTLAQSLGGGINYARMRASADRKTGNRPYLILLTAGSTLLLGVLLILKALGWLHTGGVEFALFTLLALAIGWRSYGDVEYRLSLRYRGFFAYYALISVGYALGMLLFLKTRLWPLALIPGEAAGLLLVLGTGSVFRRDGIREEFQSALNLSLTLIGSDLVSALVFNGDRIVLRMFLNGTAVTIYYLASLFGKTMTLITTPLNGVLIGYLSKSSWKLTRSGVAGIALLTAVCVAVMSCACTAASWVVLPLLYPADAVLAQPYYLAANAAQVLYFAGNVLLSTVLLRYTPPRNQVIVNAAYCILFVGICLPLAVFKGFAGFSAGILAASTGRMLLCFLLLYRCVGTTNMENHQ